MLYFFAFLKHGLKLEVLSDCVQAGVFFSFYPRLALVEGNCILDFLVIVRVVAL